jgi:O-antigen ligase/polysaccharide polymerase Wzy-like membrane protein
MKLALAAALAFGLTAAIAVSRRGKLVLLFAWIVSLTYNRQYFSFDAVAGDNGMQGPYWIVSDLFLVLLTTIWLYEAAILKRRQEPRGPAVYWLFLPLATVGLLSSLGAERPDWSLYELLRAARVVVILLYVRCNFTRAAWWTAAAAMIFAAVFQAGLGIAEVATQRSGVSGVLGAATPDIPEPFAQERFFGWFRATGTMNHPPNLACYFLLTIPLAVALGLAAPPLRTRAAAAAASLIALTGLACTLSRWPWMLAAVQVLLVVAALTALRLVPVRRTIAVLVIGGLAAATAIVPFSQLIVDRVTRDLDRSIAFRNGENDVALAMFADHPLIGVGLNNYSRHIARYGSELSWALDFADLAVKQVHVRFIAAPQNGFLLPLAETGLLGFAAFMFYLGGALTVGLRSIAVSRGLQRAALVGLVAGMLGVMAQEVFDYSLWVDPVFYTFALIVGMLSSSPALWPNDAPSHAR